MTESSWSSVVEQGMSQAAESNISTKELAPYISATISHSTKQLLPRQRQVALAKRWLRPPETSPVWPLDRKYPSLCKAVLFELLSGVFSAPTNTFTIPWMKRSNACTRQHLVESLECKQHTRRTTESNETPSRKCFWVLKRANLF